MQNANEDTEWNDILRSKGILPQKEKEISEDDIVKMVETTIEEKQAEKSLEELTLDELDELEDDEDDEILLQYRNKRIAEMLALASKAKYGNLGEITGQEYVNEVNKAGEGIWVVLHLYQTGLWSAAVDFFSGRNGAVLDFEPDHDSPLDNFSIPPVPLCALLNKHLADLARKFPATKFLKSVSVTCIPNYPDKNLPTIFVYYEGDMKQQFIGPSAFRRQDITVEELEWMLGQTGAFKTDIEEDPRPKEKPKDVFYTSLREDLGGENDWF